MIGNGVHDEACDATKRARAATGERDGHDDKGYQPPRPLDGVMQQIHELIEHANLYVEARKDMVRASLRGLILKAIVGVVGAIAGVTLIIVATVYLMSGIAHGLGWLFGERYWLGELVTAVTVFLVLAIGAFIGIRSLTKSARERTVKKYEQRQQAQRQRFGRSTAERAEQLRQSHRV